MSVIIFLLVIFVLVLVHEWGHFIVAKKSGMRVDEFGIGFPPKLFGIRRGETEYTFNLFPIGGFVRIHGENGADEPDEATDGGLEEYAAFHPADEGHTRGARGSGDTDGERSFTAKSRWKQAAVLIAGVAMNVLFAFVLVSVVFMIGTLTAVSEDEASPDASLVVTDVLPESPAALAGIERGARITGMRTDELAIDSPTPSVFQNVVSENTDTPITVEYTLGGEARESTIEPRTEVLEDDASQPAVGVALTLLDTVSYPPHEAIARGAAYTAQSLWQITVGISGLLWDAVRLDADLSNVAGPVGIVGLVDDASAFGLTSLMMFTAFISLNLAIINLLPFPALDGGRLLFVGIEAVKGTPIRPQWVAALNTVGFALLILLMVAVTYNDILRLM